MKESPSTFAYLSSRSGFRRYKMRRKLFSVQRLPAVLLPKENYALLLHGQVIPTTCAKVWFCDLTSALPQRIEYPMVLCAFVLGNFFLLLLIMRRKNQQDRIAQSLQPSSHFLAHL